MKMGFETGMPTLILAEISLVYIDPEAGDKIVDWFFDNMDCSLKYRGVEIDTKYKNMEITIPDDFIKGISNNLVFVTLEHTQSQDVFGRKMVENLEKRGIRLKSLEKYPDVHSLVCGRWKRWKSIYSTLDDLWNNWTPCNTKKFVSSLGVVDEVEEWVLLSSHYVLLVSYK